MADVKWIKIATEVFDNRKIKQIERMPEGDAIIVVWFKLLCLAGTCNKNGMIFLTEEIPYTEEMLATEFNMEQRINVLKLALKTFEHFRMIEIIDNIFYISSWEKYQNIEALEKIREQTRVRVAKHRDSQKQLPCNVTVTEKVTQCNAIESDIEIDKDKDIDKKNSRFTPPALEEIQAYCKERNNDVDPQKFFDYFNTPDTQGKTWYDSKGNKVKNWKQKIITWEKRSGSDGIKNVAPKSTNKFNNFPQREYTPEEYAAQEKALLNKTL